MKDGETLEYRLTPKDLGFETVPPESLAGSDPETAAEEALRILRGERGPKRDMVLANAAAGLYVGGKSDSLREAVEPAREALDSGRALGRLRALIRATGGDGSKVDTDG